MVRAKITLQNKPIPLPYHVQADQPGSVRSVCQTSQAVQASADSGDSVFFGESYKTLLSYTSLHGIQDAVNKSNGVSS